MTGREEGEGNSASAELEEGAGSSATGLARAEVEGSSYYGCAEVAREEQGRRTWSGSPAAIAEAEDNSAGIGLRIWSANVALDNFVKSRKTYLPMGELWDVVSASCSCSSGEVGKRATHGDSTGQTWPRGTWRVFGDVVKIEGTTGR